MSKRLDRRRRKRLQGRRPVCPGPVVVPASRTAGGTPSLEDRLARLLDAPGLARLVPHLSADTLHQLIRYRGLEASGELLAAATREQISSVLDVDLWGRTQAESDEHFDPSRFGEWIETLVATDEALAARIVSRADERLVILGLSSHIRVFDPVTRMVSQEGDDTVIDGGTALKEPTSEVGGYLVTASRTDAWDAIVALLLSLEADHRGCFDAVMRGCRRLSDSIPEIDGCDDLLTEPEQLLHDLALARQARRSGRGYLASADARMVLELARRPPPGARAASSSIRLIAADYLHADDEATPLGGWLEGQQGSAAAGPPTAENPEDSVETVVELLAEAGLVPERPRALLEGTAGQPSPVERMRALLAHVHDADDSAYAARSRELAFLANALMAGCSIQSRQFTALEASDAAVAVCNLGLEEWQAPGSEREPLPAGPAALPDLFLADHDLISVFQLGWTALHEMSMSMADRLVAVLRVLRSVDAETQQGLDALRRELVKQCTAGTPWRARDALDVIAVLDLPAWVSLLGVLDECPVLPAALTATLERRTGAVSATAFEFISTRRQVAEVRAFAAKLVDILLSAGSITSGESRGR